MVKAFFPIIILPLLTSNTYVRSEVKTSATGDNASVRSEVRTTVDGQTVEVISTESGEIKVEVINDEIKVEADPPVTPTIYKDDSAKPKSEEMEIDFESKIPTPPQEKPRSTIYEVYQEIQDFFKRFFLNIIKVF